VVRVSAILMDEDHRDVLETVAARLSAGGAGQSSRYRESHVSTIAATAPATTPARQGWSAFSGCRRFAYES